MALFKKNEPVTDINKFVPGSIAKQFSTLAPKTQERGGFIPGSIANEIVPKRAITKNLDSSDGLYNLAVQNGLQGQADSILKQQSGEETKKIFSGGFISDIFDTLNALQYGVVGVLKGKSFAEGVKTRQSFSDQDALGSKGLPGVIGGILLDIAVDPITYIAPYTILKKVPILGRAVKAVEGALFGRKVTKTIKTVKGLKKSYEALEGGTRVGKYLAQKFAWMFGADPIFRQTFERSMKNTAISTNYIAKMIEPIIDLSPKTAAKLLTNDDTGRLIRVPLEALKGSLSGKEYKVVKKIYDTIDNLGKEAVDLGILGKGKFEENLGTYLKNTYEEFEFLKKSKFGYGKVGLKGFKARKAVKDISEFGLTQIDNPSYLLFKSAVDLTKDVENAKLFKIISEKFGTDIAQDGFSQIAKTAKFTTTAGKQADILTGVKKVNSDLKPLLKSLKQTFKADKKTLLELSGIEKEIGKIGSLRADELYKFFSEGTAISKTISSARKLGTIPETLQPMANAIKKVDNFDAFVKTADGIQLEKLFVDGVLERNGFSSMESFFNTVKKPFVKATEKVGKETLEGSASKIIKLQTRLEILTKKSADISDLTKTSINDSFIALEKNISDLTFSKEGLLQSLEDAKLGDLAGKYVPDHIKEYLTEIINPSKDTINKQIVANFKFFKVIMNPATHARNIVSNKILNWWKLGMNPLDPRVISSDLEAVKEIARKGGKWTDLATKEGYNINTFVSSELMDTLNLAEVSKWGESIKGWAKVKKTLGNIYQAEENHAKLSAFIFNMKKGLKSEEAWKLAESATFNYSQVTPFIRKLRESLFGVPFITFTVKSTPVVLETALKAPHRISAIGKIKNSIENLSDLKETDRERASEPSWVKDGFYIKLPMKDEQGRSAYFDLTYILPFGDLLAGNFLERNKDLSTGLKESQINSLMKKSPFIQVVAQLGKNKDFYGNSIWKNTDSTVKQTGDLMRHLTKAYIPPIVGDQLPGGYNYKGERQQRGILGAVKRGDEDIGQKRNLMQELIRNVGAKIQPIDADIGDTYAEWNKKKALQNLLLENGIGTNFERFYIPKEKE